MDLPRIPHDEARRPAALHSTNILGSQPEEAFDRITRLTSKLLEVPIVLVSLIEKDDQFYKSHCGFAPGATPRASAICAHAILTDEPFIVEDTLLDPRFEKNPLVVDEHKVRFYTGIQLYSVDRLKLGTLLRISSGLISTASSVSMKDSAIDIPTMCWRRLRGPCRPVCDNRTYWHGSAATNSCYFSTC